MNTWRQILSWSEVNSKSYIGWLVAIKVGYIPKDYYMVVMEEVKGEDATIFGSWGKTEEIAMLNYNELSRARNPVTLAMWYRKYITGRVRKIF